MMPNPAKQKAFTLIEVVVALTILGWVLGSVLFLVSQYADERSMMRERFYSNQVAWNQLMENYQRSRGWMPLTESTDIILNGEESQGGQNWNWQMDVATALGRDLFRYEAIVYPEETDSSQSRLVMYLVNQQGGQQ